MNETMKEMWDNLHQAENIKDVCETCGYEDGNHGQLCPSSSSSSSISISQSTTSTTVKVIEIALNENESRVLKIVKDKGFNYEFFMKQALLNLAKEIDEDYE